MKVVQHANEVGAALYTAACSGRKGITANQDKELVAQKHPFGAAKKRLMSGFHGRWRIVDWMLFFCVELCGGMKEKYDCNTALCTVVFSIFFLAVC